MKCFQNAAFLVCQIVDFHKFYNCEYAKTDPYNEHDDK